MEPSRIVEILQDGKSRGTGYLLTPNHVLTARHVVNPEVVGTACTVARFARAFSGLRHQRKINGQTRWRPK